MILNPHKWPMLVLPLKRRNPFEDGNIAYIALPLSKMKISEREGIEIRLGSVYDKNLSGHKRVTYANVDALLEDGWRVD